MKRPDTFPVLLVEDNPGDVELTREALKDGKILVDLSVAEDGEQAMKLLRREPPFENARRPGLILLDLNLPSKDGREVLAEIKRDMSLRHIPVVVLTTSEAEADILRSYSLGCNCYATKPVGLKEFVHIVKAIESFWLTVVQLPPSP